MSGQPRRNRGGGPLSREVQVSKKLSWLLRHGAEKEGLVLGQEGYLNMATVLANRHLRSLKVTFDEVQILVRDNDKQRFSLIPDPSRFPPFNDDKALQPLLPSNDPRDWIIRANQGHSIKMESDAGLLTKITKDNMPSQAIHGTTYSKWALIASSGGLKPMGRNHVHFAAGLPDGFKSLSDGAATHDDTTSAPVISGMRSSSKVLIHLDVPKALDAGLPLWLSQNGVILSEGDARGHIPLELCKLVEDRTGKGVLLEDGRIVQPGDTQKTTKDAIKT